MAADCDVFFLQEPRRALFSRRGLADLCWTVFVRVEILGTFLLAEEAGGEGSP